MSTTEASVPVQVPWTEEMEARLRELAEAENDDLWAAGDQALAAVPKGDKHVHNNAKAFLELLAHRTGWEFNTLRSARQVAYAWPDDLRRPSASFLAHKTYMKGGPTRAAARAELFDRIAADAPGGRVTVKLVKEHKPTKTKAGSSTKAERRSNLARRGADLLGEIAANLGPEDAERLQHAIGILGRLQRDDV